jgi:hypothetical protein
MTQTMSITDFSREKLVELCKHYENELNHRVAINNELVKQLHDLPDFAGVALNNLNEWLLICGDLSEASAQEIHRIIMIKQT